MHPSTMRGLALYSSSVMNVPIARLQVQMSDFAQLVGSTPGDLDEGAYNFS